MYECIKCNYFTTKKSDWNKHIITKKHKKLQMTDQVEIKKPVVKKKVSKSNNSKRFKCENCGLSYKFRSGLSRHEVRCNVQVSQSDSESEPEPVQQPDPQPEPQIESKPEPKSESQPEPKPELQPEPKPELQPEPKPESQPKPEPEPKQEINLEEAYKKMIQAFENKVIKKQQEQISDLQSMLKISIEKTKETVSEMLPRIGNTTNITNQMTVNIFLNEECKNAINLNDFLHSLDLSVDDLLYTSQNGYSKGIANIFVKKLQNLKPTERPIHCSDNNQLQFYIKDQNRWEKDYENIKIDRSIEEITRKQIQQIIEWERNNPTWQHTDKESKFYMKLIKETVGGLNQPDRETNFEEIKKELGTTVRISEFIESIDKITND